MGYFRLIQWCDLGRIDFEKIERTLEMGIGCRIVTDIDGDGCCTDLDAAIRGVEEGRIPDR